MTGAIALRPPYLVFTGDQQNPAFLKTGFGIVHWRRDLVAGQFRLTPDTVDLGVPDLDLASAIESGVKSLIIGVAPVGGVVSEAWWRVLIEAADNGLDVVSGLHGRLADHPPLRAAAERTGARLIDVRVPPPDIPVGTGRKRTGRRLLTIGTDCAVGKKYSALSLAAALSEAGVKATYRASGQTGIMIAGQGIAIDAVVSDFVSGAAELLSPDNDPDHWDVIEGQGSLFHPGYAGVSLGLLHGSQPDALVVCHDPTRTSMLGWPDFAPPGVAECAERALALGRLTNPAIRWVGVCVNTAGLATGDRQAYLRRLAMEVGRPCVDPVIDGCEPIVRALLTQHA